MSYKKSLHRSILSVFLAVFLLCRISLPSSASERKRFLSDEIYVSEENYSYKMNNEVIPYLNSIAHEGSITAEDNVHLYYRKYIVDRSFANIVISHNFAEYIDKYDELIYYFAKSGYNVFMMEHRGNGRSECLGIADSTQIHVDDADSYISDMKKFIDTVVITQDSSKKIFLFAHSTGAAIAAKFMMENSDVFDAAVLTSPTEDMCTSHAPQIITKLAADSAVLLGYGGEYLPCQNSYNIQQNLDSSDTSSSQRFYYFYDYELTNESVRRGGFSFKWLSEICRIKDFITHRKNIENLTTPILLLETKKPNFFNSWNTKKFVKHAKECTLSIIKGSKKDVYRETDKIQRPAIEMILQYYSKFLQI